ncbi:sugar-binding transcriptional regulator [Agrococcus sediminis]|uniref:sugar-binding transcriptional regulator n=1 Tax=Agrococcus sediminis TaxID=2599924 RepID=UPI0034429468
MAAVTRAGGLGDSMVEAALVARRYYLDGKQKSEIAQELGISRFKVARLLDEARSSGIVKISIELPTSIDLELGERVASTYGLRRAIVVTGELDDPAALAATIGQAAAVHIAGVLAAEDILGLAWGRSLTAMADALQGRSGADVVQLVGGVRADGATVSGVELVRRVAERTGGVAHPLHAPLVVGSAAMAQELLKDPALADATGRFDRLTVCAFGVGSWEPAQSALFSELPHDARAELRRGGAVADLCGIAIDESGRAVRGAASERIVGIGLDELRRVPEVVAMAGGAVKAPAIKAVLRTGLISTLVTDVAAARALI